MFKITIEQKGIPKITISVEMIQYNDDNNNHDNGNNGDNDSKKDKLAEKIIGNLIRSNQYSSYPEDLANSAYVIASAMLKESEYRRTENKKKNNKT